MNDQPIYRVGFTLVELMIAIAASSLICSAVVAFVSAAVGSSQAGLQRSDTVAAREVAARRLAPILRANIAILDLDESWALLWYRDPDANGEPSSNELRILHLESNSLIQSTLTEDSFPKVQYAIGDDFSVIAQSMLDNPSASDEMLVQDVKSLVLISPESNPLDSRSIMCSIVLLGIDPQSSEIRLHERFRIDLP